MLWVKEFLSLKDKTSLLKTFFQIFLLLMLPVAVVAQTSASKQSAAPKYKMLDAQDPLIGEWEWISNDTTGIAAPIADQDWQYFKFVAGNAQSFGALSYDEGKGFGCASYFLAFSDGKHITGTLSDSCIGADKGKKFSFEYEYDAMEDLLIITVRGEQFRYKRKKA